jgi:hypothetical protein
MPSKNGVTKSIVLLYFPAGDDQEVVDALPANVPVEVVLEQGDWVLVNYQGRVGYAHRSSIAIEGEESPPQPSGHPVTVTPFPVQDPSTAPLEPPVEERLSVPPSAPDLERLTAEVWNKYGGLLTVLSNQLQIDPAVAVAVFAVESGGRGFGSDGRMLIRFEVHVFHNYWGRFNQSQFDKNFRFNEDMRWTGHQMKKAGEGWVDIHVGRQSREWEAYDLARSFSLTSARLSISMGAPQIMGFNYKRTGFNSVHEMFDAFSRGEREQIIGFFQFIKGSGDTSSSIEALRDNDFVAFARFYNGSGQAQKYGDLIQSVFDTYHNLRS